VLTGGRRWHAAPGLKYKATLSVAHGVGLRAEIISLKIKEIDSTRVVMVIWVEQG
jgi:hypothetical protein